MKSHQKIALYRERLTQWLNCPMRQEKDKPKPESFHITDRQELFIAQAVHDQIIKPK